MTNVKVCEENYNLIISCTILNKNGKFTMDDIVKELSNCGIVDLKYHVGKNILRLREDGFINQLGSRCEVVKNYKI